MWGIRKLCTTLLVQNLQLLSINAHSNFMTFSCQWFLRLTCMLATWVTATRFYYRPSSWAWHHLCRYSSSLSCWLFICSVFVCFLMVPDLVSFKLLIFFVAASHATSPLAAGFSMILLSFSSALVPYYSFHFKLRQSKNDFR